MSKLRNKVDIPHRDKERIRHQKLRKILDDVADHVPKLSSKMETKTKKLRRILLYIWFLEQKRLELGTSFIRRKGHINSVNKDKSSSKMRVALKEGSRRAHIVFLSSVKDAKHDKNVDIKELVEQNDYEKQNSGSTVPEFLAECDNFELSFNSENANSESCDIRFGEDLNYCNEKAKYSNSKIKDANTFEDNEKPTSLNFDDSIYEDSFVKGLENETEPTISNPAPNQVKDPYNKIYNLSSRSLSNVFSVHEDDLQNQHYDPNIIGTPNCSDIDDENLSNLLGSHNNFKNVTANKTEDCDENYMHKNHIFTNEVSTLKHNFPLTMHVSNKTAVSIPKIDYVMDIENVPPASGSSEENSLLENIDSYAAYSNKNSKALSAPTFNFDESHDLNFNDYHQKAFYDFTKYKVFDNYHHYSTFNLAMDGNYNTNFSTCDTSDQKTKTNEMKNSNIGSSYDKDLYLCDSDLYYSPGPSVYINNHKNKSDAMDSLKSSYDRYTSGEKSKISSVPFEYREDISQPMYDHFNCPENYSCSSDMSKNIKPHLPLSEISLSLNNLENIDWSVENKGK